jgi:hypothetical protein
LLTLGGELTEYTEMMGNARSTATERLNVQASELGAEAIINLCYVTTSGVGTIAIHQQLKEGINEVCTGVFKGERITVVGVRDPKGELIGYFERFEKL